MTDVLANVALLLALVGFCLSSGPMYPPVFVGLGLTGLWVSR